MTRNAALAPNAAPYNGLAVAAVVSAVLVNVVGAILGMIALRQIRRTNERGRGLAIAAIFIGFGLFVAATGLAVIIFNQFLTS